jgi:hypothetical protein
MEFFFVLHATCLALPSIDPFKGIYMDSTIIAGPFALLCSIASMHGLKSFFMGLQKRTCLWPDEIL